jgi:DNA-binding NtrC family response regulator
MTLGERSGTAPSGRARRPLQRLLVVDDDVSLLALHELSFGMLFSFKGVSSPLAALDLLATSQFNAILSDFSMPTYNGIWLLQRVATMHPDTRRFLMSGRKLVGVEDAKSSGLIEAFLPKPVDAQRLADYLASWPMRSDPPSSL